ncbi:LacI family DNA-binding transcriptional regulator [Tepidibacillus sp. HK-1]|uniref:LacI family DNA-binding transcriptional regulator n=1 Tax=Tepidibacillus sp. HK-1 TaxID=1883407 RepID=UPI000853B43C|nr:LacI family DNA-binding transcriptional regulator [Tepidibacillus sp. HK-1]GBF12563.1 catabolite control protein A [Tepidibacillus sp. HK-1]
MASSKDVAKLAGVSQSTVSRVINGSNNVRKETVQKVMKAMKELNFRPNNIARSLVKNKTNTLALISGHLHNPFFVETTTTIVNKASEKGYNTLVYFENQGNNMHIYQTVFSHKVDGIILSSIFIDDPVYYELEQLGIPFVMFNRRHRQGGNFVEIDNYKAATIATQHLVSHGHKKIAYIGGPVYTSTFLGRQNGYIDTLKKNDILVDSNLIKVTDTSEEDVIKAIDELMAIEFNRPTAILASTDSLAIFSINHLIRSGFKIPEDLSICGIDNIQISSHQSMQLTSVGVTSNKNMGEIAIRQLIKLVESKEKESLPMQITLDPKLIVRRTTARIT